MSNVSSKKINAICLLLILLLAFLFRFYHLSERSLDIHDEAFYANQPGSVIVFFNYILKNLKKVLSGHIDKEEIRREVIQNSPTIFAQSGKPTHALLLLFGASVLGYNDFSLFFFVLVIDLLSLVVLYKICCILFDPYVGLFSAFFFSISGTMIFFARTTMPQTAMVLFCLFAFYSSLKIGQKNWNILFGFSSALAFFTHPSTGLLLIVLWTFAVVSVIQQEKATRFKTTKHIILAAGIPAMIFIAIKELPYLMFKGVIKTPETFVSTLFERATKYGMESGGFSQLSLLVKNIWKSELFLVVFIVLGFGLLLIKFNKFNQIKVLVIPLAFCFLYFLFPIKYRYRIFILIHPFLHIIGGVALGYLYNYNSFFDPLKRKRPLIKMITRIVLISFLFVLLVASAHRVGNSVTSNKKSIYDLCSRLDAYLANLPYGESRDISDDQGHLSPIIQFYFSKHRIQHIYPHLTKSLIWDWRRERPGKDSHGDIIILFENGGFSDQLPLDKIRSIIGNRQPIFKIPYLTTVRRGYLDTPFKTKRIYLEVYDLKLDS